MSSRKFIYKNSKLFYANAKDKKIGRNFKKSFRPKLELLVLFPLGSDKGVKKREQYITLFRPIGVDLAELYKKTEKGWHFNTISA